MSKKLLIATLGTTPAVITEAIDLLADEGIHIDGVFLLMTQDVEVKESFELLAEHLPFHDNITWISPVYIAAYEDVNTPETVIEFMQEACFLLKGLRDNGHRLFVSIAGGRKAMSALLALAVQFYGAERLFHIWVPPWIEEEGDISKLRSIRDFPEELNRALHPSLQAEESDRPKLVPLPFISLFPLLHEMLDALKGREVPPRELKQVLIANGLLTSQGKPTPLGREVATILENVESLPPARQEEYQIHISKHKYEERLRAFARQLADRFPFITRIRGEPWGQGEEVVKARLPNILIVGTRLGTDILFKLSITTTASNQGQLEAARKAVERFIRLQK